ncbi:hypothetical protein D3C87_1868420 [compost metagenome]
MAPATDAISASSIDITACATIELESESAPTYSTAFCLMTLSMSQISRSSLKSSALGASISPVSPVASICNRGRAEAIIRP